MDDGSGRARGDDWYRSIFASLPVPVWVVDPASGMILDASDAAVDRLGYAREELRARSIRDIAEWREGSPLRVAWESGGSEARTGIRSRFLARNGSWVDVEAILHPAVGAIPPFRVVQAVDPVAEPSLVDAGERYRLAAQASRDALYDWDLRSDSLWWSEQFLEHFGHTSHEVGADLRSWERLVHPEDLERVWSGIRRSMDRHAEVWQDEYRLRRGDGSYAHVHDRARFIYDDACRPVRVVGLVTDVTTRTDAESALRRTQEMFRASVESHLDPLGICESVRDASGRIVDFRIVYVNAAAEESNGMSRDEQLGRLLGETLPPLRESGIIDRYAQVVETGEPLMLQHAWFEDARGGDVGARRAYDIRATRLGDGLVSTWRDVTRQVQAQEALRRSEERFREIAENIREIFWISDPAFSRLMYLSLSFEEIWGYPRKPFYRNPRAFLDAVHPEDRERVRDALADIARGEFDQEYRIIRPDGAVRWTRVRGFPVRGDDGEIQRIAGIAEDVTQQKQDELRIQKALTEKEVLLRELHHRVKNNLQIVSSLMRLQSRTPAAREVRDILRENQARVQSMALLHELLYRSNNLGCIELADYLRRLGRHLCQLFGVDGRIRFSVSGTQSVGLDTAVACGLIANELISNSIRHAFPDSRTGSVRVTLERRGDGEGFRMLIRDDGVGMAAGQGSSGEATLGLRLVAMLADQLGSTVDQWLEEGTVTSLHIPLSGSREVTS